MLIVGLVLAILGVKAMAAPEKVRDDALLARAQQAVAAGQWDEAVAAVESLRKQFPKSALLPDGLVLQYHAYLEHEDADKAEAVRKEIITRWPRSDYVWRMLLITCKKQAETLPGDAVATLDEALKLNLLAPADRAKAQKFRYTYQEAAKADHFVSGAIKRVRELTPPVAQEELLLTAAIVQKVYLPLMRRGRYDIAREMFLKMQTVLAAAADDLREAMTADQQAYFKALRAADKDRFLAETLRIVQQAEAQQTPAAVMVAADLSATLYVDLLRGKRFDDARTIHDGIHAAARQLQLPPARLEREVNGWYAALLSFNREQLVLEMRELISRLTEATAADEVVVLPQYLAPLYADCFKQRRPEEAQALHARVQAFLQRCQRADDALLDQAQYACEEVMSLRAVSRERYLAEAPARLTGIVAHASSVLALNQVARVTGAFGLYQDLFRAGHKAEAETLSAQFADAVTRIDAANLRLRCSDRTAYLTAFGQHDAEGFTTAFLPLALQAGTLDTPDELRVLVDVVAPAYRTLVRNGRTEEAKRLHAQLQAALKRFPALQPLAEVEAKRYRNIVPGG